MPCAEAITGPGLESAPRKTSDDDCKLNRKLEARLASAARPLSSRLATLSSRNHRGDGRVRSALTCGGARKFGCCSTRRTAFDGAAATGAGATLDWGLRLLHRYDALAARTVDRLDIILGVDPSTLACRGIEDLEPALLGVDEDAIPCRWQNERRPALKPKGRYAPWPRGSP